MATVCLLGAAVLLLLVTATAASTSPTALPARHLAAALPASVSPTNQSCLSNLVSSLNSSCTSNSTQRDYTFQKLVSRTYQECLDTVVLMDDAGQEQEHILIMVPLMYQAAYSDLLAAFSEQYHVTVALAPVDAGQLRSEVMNDLFSNLTNSHDGWILPVFGGFPFFVLGGLTELTNATSSDNTALAYEDIYEPYRHLGTSREALGNGLTVKHTTFIPIDGSAPIMYYRTDILTAAGLLPPRTWSEVLYVADKLNQSRNASMPQYSVCVDPDRECGYAWMLAMMMAPYLQYNGTHQGMYIDPATYTPLFDNAGAQLAAQQFADLMTYSPPTSAVDGCPPYGTTRFREGECSITFGWGYLFKDIELEINNTFQQGRADKINYGMTPLPGSEQIWDRDTQELLNCTAELCFYGIGGQPEAIVRQQDGADAFVNRAPLLPWGGLLGFVNPRSSAAHQQATTDFFSFLSAPENHLSLVLSGSSPTLPFRHSSLSIAVLNNYTKAGYGAETTQQYFAVQDAVLNHPNIVLGPEIPGIDIVRDLLQSNSLQLSGGGDVPLAMETLQNSTINSVTSAAAGAALVSQINGTIQYTLQMLMDAYWAYIGYVPPANEAGNGTSVPAVALAVPVACTVLVILLSTVYEVKKNRQHTNMFGKVVAPGAYEDTTLLVTDIQDSTALWELLPSTVMDQAIKEHHQCIRKLLLKHSGYESATEGDSFLLAFHCPEDALLFAMEAQVALLECNWPPELLECATCKPFYVVQVEQDKRTVLSTSLILDDNSDQLSHMPGPFARTTSSNSLTSSSENSNPTPSYSNSNSQGLTMGTENNTFITVCQASWKEAQPATPNNVLIFRGLRVRMGMGTGIANDADVTYNKAAARMQYSGEILHTAKAVSDAAAGGMILLADNTYSRLPMERLWDKAMVMHVGTFVLKNDAPGIDLYQVTGRRLMGRMGHLSPMRFVDQLSRGVLSAPLGAVAVCYMSVVGIEALLSWNSAVAEDALRIFTAEATAELRRHNGYLVDASPLQMMVVFHNPAEAVLWALSTHKVMMEQDWPVELLDHELCEELVVGETVVFRGLRLKTGIDVGIAVGEVNAMTGRICYRGKVIQRAARIMMTAASNQVLCSADAWSAAMSCGSVVLSMSLVAVDKMGPFKLRGTVEKTELLHCRLLSQVPSNSASVSTPREGSGLRQAWQDELLPDVGEEEEYEPVNDHGSRMLDSMQEVTRQSTLGSTASGRANRSSLQNLSPLGQGQDTSVTRPIPIPERSTNQGNSARSYSVGGNEGVSKPGSQVNTPRASPGKSELHAGSFRSWRLKPSYGTPDSPDSKILAAAPSSTTAASAVSATVPKRGFMSASGV